MFKSIIQISASVACFDQAVSVRVGKKFNEAYYEKQRIRKMHAINAKTYTIKPKYKKEIWKVQNWKIQVGEEYTGK